MIGMSHRGRLNVDGAHRGTTRGGYFCGFEDVDPRSVLGSGDVKYHVGPRGNIARGKDENWTSISLRTRAIWKRSIRRDCARRAKQARIGSAAAQKILPMWLHGDAAFAGQGVWAETMNLAIWKPIRSEARSM